MALDALWLSLLTGLMSGVHCVGMCGGIVGALSLGGPPRLALHLSYNFGRIASYTVAGLLAGAVGSGSAALAGQWPLRQVFLGLAALTMIALGLYLLGLTQALAPLERAGGVFWRRLQPLSRRLLPVRHPCQALLLGGLWGWLPCGLVYVALTNALSAASPLEGAARMLAFGLGTLPNLLLAGFLLTQFRAWVQRPLLRRGVGCLALAYGVFALTRLLG